MSILNAYMYTTCLSGTCGGQRRVSIPLQMKFQMGIVCARTKPWSFGKADSPLNCWAILPVPLLKMYFFFYFFNCLTVVQISTMNVGHFHSHFPPIPLLLIAPPFHEYIPTFMSFIVCDPPSEFRVTSQSMDQRLFSLVKTSSLWLQHWRNRHLHLSTSCNCL